MEKRYNIQRQLGAGSYGTVFLGVKKATNENVAIKYMHHVFYNQEDALRSLREISIMRQCHHPNICKIIDAYIPKDKDTFNSVWIVMEYGGWDLQKIIETHNSIEGWSAQHVKFLMYQMICALRYLSSASIMHRDIKPSNILMDKQCGIHIIDFGLARRVAPNKDYHSEQFFQPITVAETNPMIIQSDALPRLDSDTTLPTLSLPQRQLTRHVATRWYRPPEVITLQVGSRGYS
ncbi:uncharacterized protein [Blastocystis hominis]|uniref:Mitogen-activated protein kinase n=1 Tax=Blastocystis hominis TaxID=12968 RepID=D8LV17_BLAHO|nr:uncharacterized protein [Blastocystis hominis]CBK19656.2 unnamed protein product [Blastocystis hominis]|eukprot:XP_012893704.1 uncharacterized protein [Blastocystis hominis]